MKPVRELVGGAQLLRMPRFEDDRGSFSIPYEVEAARTAGLPDRFVQDNHSISKPVGTLRGIHLQLPPHQQGKLIRVLRGRVLDVVVDLRPGSPTAGTWDSLELGPGDEQLWIPAGLGHGFCTLEPATEVFYKVDSAYAPDHEITLRWDDPELGIDWGFGPDQVVLSDKDARGMALADVLAAVDSSPGR